MGLQIQEARNEGDGKQDGRNRKAHRRNDGGKGGHDDRDDGVEEQRVEPEQGGKGGQGAEREPGGKSADQRRNSTAQRGQATLSLLG